MQTLVPISAGQKAFVRSGFSWDAADAYLFDIDGTLLNSRDAVHYFACLNAIRAVFGVEAGTEGIHVHGNTDPGILRAVLRRAGVNDAAIDAGMGQMVEHICAEVERNREDLRPELCPSIPELVAHLSARGKMIAVASGNLETVGWLKLDRAGLRSNFAFGSFSFPIESRADIFRHGMALARERLGEQATVAVVGDTPFDVEAARAVGMPVIALATGIFSFSDLMACGPDACFACGTDLLAYGR